LNKLLGIKEYPLNFTDWLKAELPYLESESSAITFKYIEQAKKSTANLRMLISLINFTLTVMVGYSIGYLFGKYSNVDPSIAIAISIGISILVTSRLEERIKNKVIQKELLIIAGRND
jgi:F0F1-type ATP synthase assembly protein I